MHNQRSRIMNLILEGGDLWFYAGFETAPSDRAITLVEAEMTPELEDYTQAISGAVNYVNQTFSLFKSAQKRRPKTPLNAVERG